jgi:hypothetical protein
MIGAVGEESEQTKITENLELLADFGTDVGIVRVKSRRVNSRTHKF